MGKLKNIIGAKISGNVGSMNFRKRGDEIVVAERSYSNSSKASGASEAQRLHRCRLSNLVNFYKVIAAIQARAWETKVGYQSDFNMLTKNNLSASPVFLTKQEATLNASVVAKYLVSKGTLGELVQSYADSKFNTGVVVGPNFDFANNTVAGMSNGLIYNNEGWVEGDKLTLALLTEAYVTVGGVSIPRVSVKYFELTLDTSDTTSLSEVANFADFAFSCDTNGVMFVGASARGFFGIHSRKSSGVLETSTQQVVLGAASTIYTKYTSEEQKTLSMDSYGYQPDVLLTPSEANGADSATGAEVTSITYNDVAVVDGGSIEGGHTLKIVGTGLTKANAKVTCAGVVYVPTLETSEEIDYSLATAGVVKIYINGTLKYTIQCSAASSGVTTVQLGSTSYSESQIPASNITISANENDALVVNGTNLGELTATGACTLSSVGGSTTQRTATAIFGNTAGASFTIKIGDIVIISGAIAAEEEEYGG